MKEFSPIAFLTKDQVKQMHKAVLRCYQRQEFTSLMPKHADFLRQQEQERIKTEGYSFQK